MTVVPVGAASMSAWSSVLLRPTVVVLVLPLSLGSGSKESLATLAVLFSTPSAFGVTNRLTVASWDPRSWPRLHVTDVLPVQLPCKLVAESRVTPAGKVSVTTTLFAGIRLEFLTVMRYVMVVPTATRSGSASNERLRPTGGGAEAASRG